MNAAGFLIDVFAEAEAMHLPPWELIGVPESAGHPAWFIWRHDRLQTMAHKQRVDQLKAAGKL